MHSTFLTGGTTGKSKPVQLDSLEFDYMVLDTAVVLRELGVGPSANVVLAHPGMPWAIGQVFFEACRRLGANLFAFGLASWEEIGREAWSKGRVTHILSPPSLLDVPEKHIGSLAGHATIVVAGEPLTNSLEARLRRLWNPVDLRRIYGSTEFGTLAYQCGSTTLDMAFNPRFRYSLAADGELSVIASDGHSVRTGDLVREITGARSGIWGAGFGATFVGRRDLMVHLRDGAVVHQSMVEALRESVGAEFIQVIAERSGHSDFLHFHIAGAVSLPEPDLLERLRHVNIDLFDILAGEHLKITFTYHDDVSALRRTQRGKLLPIVMMNSHEYDGDQRDGV